MRHVWQPSELALLAAIRAIVRANIRDDKVHQIYSAIQTGGKMGMSTMNQSLYSLVNQGKITKDMAFAASMNHDDLEKTFENG